MTTSTLIFCRECSSVTHEPDEGAVCTDCLRSAAYDFATPCVCLVPVAGAPVFGRRPCLGCFGQITSGGA